MDKAAAVSISQTLKKDDFEMFGMVKNKELQ